MHPQSRRASQGVQRLLVQRAPAVVETAALVAEGQFSIAADPRSNRIVVTAPANVQRDIAALLREYAYESARNPSAPIAVENHQCRHAIDATERALVRGLNATDIDSVDAVVVLGHHALATPAGSHLDPDYDALVVRSGAKVKSVSSLFSRKPWLLNVPSGCV